MEAERDRLRAEQAATQRTIQASQQAEEIRQQMAIIQAEIQSMQPSTDHQTNATPPSQSNQHLAATPVGMHSMAIPPAAHQRGLDPRSPLSEGLQSTPWPPTYKPLLLPRFNGKTDPRQFIMSFEAAVASAGGNDNVLAKSFVIAAEGDALAWYSMLKPCTVYSWENLRDKIMANFKGFSSESLTSSDLFSNKHLKGEPPRDYFQRFLHLRAKAPDVPDEVAIEAAIKGLRIGPFASHLARKKPTTMAKLHEEFEKYCRSDNDLRRRIDEA
ncbi:uncharacterized protein [Miscanthus floridulus]|uniref:uncharacterized protein n=1 Tax=Miscanthus floridulus TaxID=154761 RepID=UPI003458825B